MRRPAMYALSWSTCTTVSSVLCLSVICSASLCVLATCVSQCVVSREVVTGCQGSWGPRYRLVSGIVLFWDRGRPLRGVTAFWIDLTVTWLTDDYSRYKYPIDLSLLVKHYINQDSDKYDVSVKSYSSIFYHWQRSLVKSTILTYWHARHAYEFIISKMYNYIFHNSINNFMNKIWWNIFNFSRILKNR